MKKAFLLFLVLFYSSFILFGQKNISGTITDDSGEPLIGASLLVKGTIIGTVTDIDGTYSLDVPTDEGQTLIISYTGYATREIILNHSTIIDAILSEGIDLSYNLTPCTGLSRADKAFGSSVTTILFNWDGNKTINNNAPRKRN